MKHHSLSLLLSFVFLTGCTQKGWIYKQVVSECPQFNSAQLTHVPESNFSGIEVQFLTGAFGTLGFLNIYANQILSNEVTLQIEEARYFYTALVMKGCMRLLLPNEATQAMIEALLAGQIVTVQLDGFCTQLRPENFSKKYKRFSKC